MACATNLVGEYIRNIGHPSLSTPIGTWYRSWLTGIAPFGISAAARWRVATPDFGPEPEPSAAHAWISRPKAHTRPDRCREKGLLTMPSGTQQNSVLARKCSNVARRIAGSADSRLDMAMFFTAAKQGVTRERANVALAGARYRMTHRLLLLDWT